MIGEEQYKQVKKEAEQAAAAEELKEPVEEGKAKCKCGEVSELIEAEVDYNAVDEQGQPMSPQAAEHISKFRVLCGSCESSFCAYCRANPYHMGKTCEEIKE